MPGITRIYYRDTLAGFILDRLGLKRSAAQDKPSFSENVTMERIPEMEGDRIFYFVFDFGKGDALKAERDWTTNPLWQGLSAVKAKRVHRVSDAIWNTAGGVIAADKMLEELARCMGW